MKLLFLPLDIEITEKTFSLGEEVTHKQNYWETKRVLGKENNYQEYRSLLDQIPVDNMHVFTHKIQQVEVIPHYDYHGEHNEIYKHFVENEPAGYHVVLKGEPDALEIYNGKKWITPILPKVPIAYLLNLTSCIHRVKKDNLRETLYIQGWLNVEKHKQMIERSLKRYGDLAIYNQI